MQFEQYSKLIYLDADIQVYDNIDQLFDLLCIRRQEEENWVDAVGRHGCGDIRRNGGALGWHHTNTCTKPSVHLMYW